MNDLDDDNDNDNDDDDNDAGDNGAGDSDVSNVYVEACGAFCRGRLSLPHLSDVDAIRAGRAAGLRLHRFKRASVLPRVQRIIGAMRGLGAQRVLDVGTGRGALLWPLLEAFPDVDVTCLDVRADRVADLQALHDGGFTRVHAVCGSIETAELGGAVDTGGAFDVAIASEVLEHVADEKKAAQRLVRAARFVLVTVPSLPDDNPEHIRLFTADSLRATFIDAGAKRVSIDGVRGHFFAVVASGVSS